MFSNRLRQLFLLFVFIIVVSGIWTSAAGAVDSEGELQLTPALLSGQKVGTPILWVAVYKGANRSDIRYRFEIGPDESNLSVVKDFSPDNSFLWVPIDQGDYLVRVIAKDFNNGGKWEDLDEYSITSRQFGQNAWVDVTLQHPLVMLYSAPPCDSENAQVRVNYRVLNRFTWRSTPWQTCLQDRSNNFYVAGLKAATNYELQHEVMSEEGKITKGRILTRRTRELDKEMPKFTVLKGAGVSASRDDEVLLQSVNGGPNIERVLPVATNLEGDVVWYYKFREYENDKFPWHVGEYIARPLPGGHMLMFINYDGNFDYILREIDLLGNVVKETNIEQVNRQLNKRGHEEIGYFHHEALRLDNGWTLVIGSKESILTDTQGEGAVNVVGDMVIALNEDLVVKWVWDPFEHLDTGREAVLGEVCTVITVGCPPLSKDVIANDWTHINAIAHMSDGNLLLSLRNQDWIIKIDYREGKGNGRVLWRLGKGGDFALTSSDPSPWFSHQHDLFIDENRLIVFDNGNTRCEEETEFCQSRGQVYQLDERLRTASLLLNVNLGGYSSAFGSAQKLSNGNYHFLSGILLPGVVSQSIEVDPGGKVVFTLETKGSQYRSFRMPDMYSPLSGSQVYEPAPSKPNKYKFFIPLVGRE